jgi:aryl-alcohol dehydrogenase-like predicted oxidoreductase
MTPVITRLQQAGRAGIPTRPLGTTGERVSIIGYGGWDVGVHLSVEEAIRHVHEAVDGGITFFDNAWEYNGGRSEDWMGQALAQEGYREKVFLMTKVCARDYEWVRRQIDDSLARLRTDRVDLLQFHAIQYPGDPERIFDPEKGGMRAVLEAREAGKLRYVGFSGHMFPEMHLCMLGMPFHWDTVQMPLNLLDAHFSSFQKQVLPVALEKGVGVLGMKSLAGGDALLPRELNISVELCRRYALSLPVSTVICGMQTPEELRADLGIARDFEPLTEEEINRLLDVAREPAADGHLEGYKDRRGWFGCSYHAGVLRSEAEVN